jgi:hypothetical protein
MTDGEKTPRKKAARRPARMKAYATFDAWRAGQSPAHRRLIGTLRRLVADAAPALEESVKWGNGCWLKGKSPIVYLHAETDHLHFGFFHGATLDDPRGLLHGKGKYVRHVKVHRPADIDAAALRAFVRQASR